MLVLLQLKMFHRIKKEQIQKYAKMQNKQKYANMQIGP